MNATAILQQLDEREIRERLDDIDRERDALMVLLRAAVRKGKQQAGIRLSADPSERQGGQTQ